MIAKGCLYHIVRVRDLESEVPQIELVPVLRKFLDVFPEDLIEIPPEKENDFVIDLFPDT